MTKCILAENVCIQCIYWNYVVFRSGINPAVYFMCLDTMLGQMRDTGDINLSHYSKQLAVRHGLRLSNTEMYIHLHDILAWATQGGIGDIQMQ